jgi:hypothetical protein
MRSRIEGNGEDAIAVGMLNLEMRSPIHYQLILQ